MSGCIAMTGVAVAWNWAPASPRRTTRGSGSAGAPGPEASARVHLGAVCDQPGRPKRRYASVVVFAFENRTWHDVGLGFGNGMPYLHALGRQCSYFADWRNADPRPSGVAEPVGHDSVAQYVAQVTGASDPSTFDNCRPSGSCTTKANNIFRQARRAGLAAVNYVERAPSGCSAGHNAPTHVPGLYLWGGADRYYCASQVRPLRDFNPNSLPSFAFVTPTLCDSGHDCGNAVVDRWAHAHIQPVLRSRAYLAGKVAVFIWYDEDRPAPNMWITPTAESGPIAFSGAGYAGTLRAWESMLGLPCLAHACTAHNMRTATNS